MTNRAEFNDALDDCITRLNGGETLEACVQRYPDLASRLRPLLLAGRQVQAARASSATVIQSRERVRARVADSLGQPRRRAVHWPGLALAASLVFVFALVFGGGFAVVRDLMLAGSSPSPAPVVTLTARPTEVLPSPSATQTVTATPTDTATPTVTLTQSLTPGTKATALPTSTPLQMMSTTCVPLQPEGWVRYTVRSGETLSGLAARSGTMVEGLTEVNCLDDGSLIVVGQHLYLPRIPQPSTVGATIEPTRVDNSGSGSSNSGSGSSGSGKSTEEPEEDHSGSGSGHDRSDDD